MSALSEKIRRARESQFEVGGHIFTLRRPTELEMARGQTPLDLIQNHVVGWDLREIDLVPGGNPEPTPFDADAWREWVADRPELWAPLSTAIQDAYLAHAKRLEDAAKN